MANESREHNPGSPRPPCGPSGPRQTRPIPAYIPHVPRKLQLGLTAAPACSTAQTRRRRSSTPGEEGLGRGRGQPQPAALSMPGKEATGARQPATAGTLEEPYRPSRMPAAFRSPAACTQSAASSASLASTTRLRRAVGPYLVPKYALARLQTRAHTVPCPRLHAPHASVCPAP